MVGTLYYWVLHAHPVALLSYFAVVEASPLSTAQLDRIARRCGIPKTGLRTWYEHAELDIEHGEEVFETIDRLPLEPRHHEILGLATVSVVEHLSDIIDDLLVSSSAG